MKTYQELLDEARARVTGISVGDAQALHSAGSGATFLDVRDPNEFNLGTIPGAVTISRGNLEKNVESEVPRDRTVVVFCANGNRSVLAADTLRLMGYADARTLTGGFSAWVAEGGEVD